MRVICNTSPLILLAKVDRLALPSLLFDVVIVPAKVQEEIAVKGGSEHHRLQALIQRKVFQIQAAKAESLDQCPEELGYGEREVIALGLEGKADLLVIDDHVGRRIAQDNGFTVTGTIGILIEARGKGIVPHVRPELDRLMEAGMWLHEAFYQRILRECGE